MLAVAAGRLTPKPVAKDIKYWPTPMYRHTIQGIYQHMKQFEKHAISTAVAFKG